MYHCTWFQGILQRLSNKTAHILAQNCLLACLPCLPVYLCAFTPVCLSLCVTIIKKILWICEEVGIGGIGGSKERGGNNVHTVFILEKNKKKVKMLFSDDMILSNNRV